MNAPIKPSATIFQRVTQMLRKSDAPTAPAAAPAPAAPVESEEKKQERLDAYKKFCEEQAAIEEPSAKKKMKFRAKDFNA